MEIYMPPKKDKKVKLRIEICRDILVVPRWFSIVVWLTCWSGATQQAQPCEGGLHLCEGLDVMNLMVWSPPNPNQGSIPELVKVAKGEGATNCVAMTSICWKRWVFFGCLVSRTRPPASAAKMEVAMRRGDIRHTRQGLRRAVVSEWNIYFIDLSKRKPFTWKYVKFKKCWELQFNLHEVSIHPPPGSGSSSLLEPGI